MDKKASTEHISVIGGLIIAALITIVLISLIYIILPKSANEDKTVTEFYFNSLVKDIKDLDSNSLKTTLLFSDEDRIIVGFSKNINEIKILSDICGKVDTANTIKKPKGCQGNSCLCLCAADTKFGYHRGTPLLIDCETEDSKCEQFSEDVIGASTCNYFLYYDSTKRVREAEISKSQGMVIIKPK